jgi:uncharacterized LabA/DUF88 family protein
LSNLKNPAQRVGVFVDVQNMYYSAKALYGHRVNFGEILKEAVAGRQLVRAVAYTIQADMPEEQSFFDALEGIGFEVKSKGLQTFVSGQKKGDWDVGVAVDVLKMAPKLDAIVLVSGDGDYVDLLHHVKAEGCRAEVISFGKSTSAKLKEEADDFVDMDLEADKYTMRPKRPMTGPSGPKGSGARQIGNPAKTPVAQQPKPSAPPEAPKPPQEAKRPQTPGEMEDAIINATKAPADTAPAQSTPPPKKKFRIFK